MTAGTPGSVSFRDAKQQTASMRFYVVTGGATALPDEIEDIKNAVALLSNATTRSSVDPATTNTAGAVAKYEDVEDKAVFVFQTTSGSLHRYEVAAPKAAIFLADDETIDFANANVASFVTNMLMFAVSRDGLALASSVGGYRKRTKTQRKFNIFTRNPALTGQGL